MNGPEVTGPDTALSDAAAYLRWLRGLNLETREIDLSGGGRRGMEEPPSQAAAAKPARADRAETRLPAPAGGSATPPPANASAAKGSTDPSDAPAGPPGADALETLAREINNCRACRLCETATRSVPGEGDPRARLMFIGEAPGETEDRTGRPFVGRAGQLLTAELARHGIARADVFITNICKHRPPDNRDPLPDEIAACAPFLHRQIEAIRPALLCGLGRFACGALTGAPVKIMTVRGTWTEYRGVPLLLAPHPSAALRGGATMDLFKADIATLAARYHAEHPKGNPA